MATQTVNMEEELQQLNKSVKAMLLRGLEEEAARVNEAIKGLRLDEETKPAPKPAPYRSETLRIELGALLRGTFRRRIAMETNLEMKEYKGFLESVFVLTAHNPRQSIQIRNVQRWLRSIAED